MKFLSIIRNLKDSVGKELCSVRDNATLIGVIEAPPPLAKHIVFNPMPQKTQQCLLDNYKLPFPPELLDIYRTMNGADLFWSTRIIGKKRIPYCRLSIYGIPLTTDRKHIEPYNVSIEDLNRPAETPSGWLKFGSYYTPEGTMHRLDMYVDTDQHAVYAVEHDNPLCCIVERWSSIDECLCCIFNTLSKAENHSSIN